jgi:hypothetical protein
MSLFMLTSATAQLGGESRMLIFSNSLAQDRWSRQVANLGEYSGILVSIRDGDKVSFDNKRYLQFRVCGRHKFSLRTTRARLV